MDCDEDIKKLTEFLERLKNLNNIPFCTAFKEQNVVEHNKFQTENRLQYLQNCIRENENCCRLLNKIESYVYLLLEDCLKEQRVINADINTSLRKKCHKKITEELSLPCMKKKFCVPYFKDENGFSPPTNEDVLNRRIQGFVNTCDVLFPYPWKECEKNIIVNCVRKTEEEKWIQTLNACGLHHLVKVENMTLLQLIDERYEEYDWITISVSALRNKHSPHECRVMWFTNLHPQINQNIWTEAESNALCNMVKQFKNQDWDNIARKLGTKRTAFQCIKHFKMHVMRLSKRELLDSEKDLLKQYVKDFSFRQFIPWRKISLYMVGRKSREIIQVWAKINNDGRPQTFSLEEDIVLVAGMKLYGREFSRIRESFPDRSVQQIRRRIEVLKRRQFPRQPWSTEDDKLLKDLVQQYGFGNWLKISMHFINRDPSHVRHRIITLQKCMDKYGSNELCASVVPRTPRCSTDIVNIKLLWETAQKICEKNKICSNIDSLKKNSYVNIANKLSQILKPHMRNNRTINRKKLTPISKRGFFNFFQGAYTPNNKHDQIYIDRKFVFSSVYHTLLTLKVLKANVFLPSVEEVKKDKYLLDLDKNILEYLVNDMDTPELNWCSASKCDEIVTFPPNCYTLLALRSFLLNHRNLKEQEEGLTMQVDNIEWKNTYTSCPPKIPYYGESYDAASKLWNERLCILLDCTITSINEEAESCNSVINVFVH